jgi:hypothetical protein
MNGRFMVKGGNKDVMKYLEHLHIPMLVYITFWHHGRSRCYAPRFINFKDFSSTGEEPIIHKTNLVRMDGKYFYRNTEVIFMGRRWFSFRRFPRKWLKEYDDMLLAKYPSVKFCK